MEHINAPYLRALAEGQQLFAKRPGDDDFEPLTCTSTTAFHALLLPHTGLLSGWEFRIGGEDDE